MRNEEIFDQKILNDVTNYNITLVQAGQLFKLRAGYYDEIGVYYDASASAYQIMGVLTGDKALCN